MQVVVQRAQVREDLELVNELGLSTLTRPGVKARAELGGADDVVVLWLRLRDSL